MRGAGWASGRRETRLPRRLPLLLAKPCGVPAHGAWVIVPYLAATRPHQDAADLLALFGPFAVDEAAARAARSRTLGNHLHFCRWREVGRLLALLDTDEVSGTIH